MRPLVEIKRNILEKNDLEADRLRDRFNAAGCYVTNWISSPGSGKTALLEETLRELIKRGESAAAIVGDMATALDADRLSRSGAMVKQIETIGCCHLESDMIINVVESWDLSQYNFVFIENVGNLVCPSSYDLGEDERVVCLSVTEGEDKPLKYPSTFMAADTILVTKIDLAAAVEFDRDALLSNIRSVTQQPTLFETSAKRGIGIEAWIDHLIQRRIEKVTPVQV